MKTWYSCKVKHSRETDDGFLKQVTDSFLVDAVSYTDAETRMTDIAAQDIHGEFAISNISKTNIAEVIPDDDAHTWFKCKVTYSTVDGDSEKEKKINTYMLIAALHIKQAFEKIEEHFKGMVVPYEIPSITQTSFMEVYPYFGDDIPSNLKPLSEVVEAEDANNEA